MKKNTKRIGIVGAGVIALAGTGVAFAAFTGTGTFSAHGATGQMTTLTGTGTIDKALFPGTCENVTITFANPNPQAAMVDTSNVSVLLNNLSSSNPLVKLSPANAHLESSDYSFTVPASDGTNDGTNTITIENAACLSQSADNAAAGKAVTVSGQVPFKLIPSTEYKG